MLCCVVVVVSCHLTVCFLLSDWRFLGGLAFMGLSTTEVLFTHQHPRQLLRPHIKMLTCLLGCPLIEVFLRHLQPHSCCQDAGRSISRFVGQTGSIGDGQDCLSHLLSLFFLCCFGLLVFYQVQKPLWDVELHEWADGSIYDRQQGGLVHHLRQGTYVGTHL